MWLNYKELIEASHQRATSLAICSGCARAFKGPPTSLTKNNTIIFLVSRLEYFLVGPVLHPLGVSPPGLHVSLFCHITCTDFLTFYLEIICVSHVKAFDLFDNFYMVLTKPFYGWSIIKCMYLQSFKYARDCWIRQNYMFKHILFPETLHRHAV